MIIALYGGSGVGKTTIADLMVQKHGFKKIVTCTTREPRPGEAHGIHYHFLSRQEFEKRIAAGHFLEHAEYSGHRYGSLNEAIRSAASDKDASYVMALELQGIKSISKLCPDAARILLVAPHESILERLRGRNMDPKEIQNRFEEEKRYEEQARLFATAVFVNGDGQQEKTAALIADRFGKNA